jgi:hypothetical protein
MGPLGSDVALRTAEGQPVDVTIEAVAGYFVVRPTAPLLPGHGYELTDLRTVPCTDTGLNECALLQTPQVFASFITADVADDMPPDFQGLLSVAVSPKVDSAGDSCLGPHSEFPVTLSWSLAMDGAAGADVRYNVYRQTGATPPTLALEAGLVNGTMLMGSISCTSANLLVPGTYAVHAVDWAGNEDANKALTILVDPCANQVPQGGAGGNDGSADGGGGAQSPVDAAGNAAGQGGQGSGLPPAAGGCACGFARTESATDKTCCLVALIALVLSRRRRS